MASLFEHLIPKAKGTQTPEQRRAYEADPEGYIAEQTGRSREEVDRLNALNDARLAEGGGGVGYAVVGDQYGRPIIQDGETGERRIVVHDQQGNPIEMSFGEAARLGYLQGGMFGASDEVMAAGRATFGNVPGETWGQRYGTAIDNERAQLDMARQDQPGAAYGGEVAGGVATSLALPSLSPVKGGGIGARALNAAADGAVQGGAYMFNAAEGGARERGESAFKGAMLGAGIGATMPFLAAGVRKGVERAATNQGARQVGTSPKAYNRLVQDLQYDDPAMMQQNIQAAGRDAMLADASDTASTLLDGVTATSQRAGAVAGQRVQPRYTRAGERVSEALDDAFGPPQGVRETARGIASSTRGARQSTYDAAYSAPIDYASEAGRNVEAALGRIAPRTMQQAVEEANADMLANGVRNQQIMAQIADDGTVTFREMPNVQQLDYIKRALQGLAESNVDNFGRPTASGRRYQKLARDLRQALGDAVPEYNAATAAGADKVAQDQALTFGQQMLKPNVTREVVTETLEGMSPAERKMVGMGLRMQIDETIANVRMAISQAGADEETIKQALKGLNMLSSGAARQKIGQLLGPARASRLFNVLDESARSLNLRSRLALNSKTAVRQGIDQRIGEDVQGGIGQYVTRPMQAVDDTISAVTGQSRAHYANLADDVKVDMADVLTRGNPREIMAALLAGREIPGTAGRYGQIAQIMGRPAAPISSGIGAPALASALQGNQ